ALGVVLYEMVTGELPFRAESRFATAMKRLTEAPPSPRAICPELPERWERVILRCLERSPGARFASVVEVVQALDAGDAAEPSGGPAIVAPRRWPRRAIVGAIVLAVAVATAIAFVLTR
ncbi:MAG TPA: hypothetical protein VF945_00480, partial [Polyangia bacterium]